LKYKALNLPILTKQSQGYSDWGGLGLGVFTYFWGYDGPNSVDGSSLDGNSLGYGGVQGGQTYARALGGHDHRAANMDA